MSFWDGIGEVLGQVAKATGNHKAYKQGFEDGKEGQMRNFYDYPADEDETKHELYHIGYTDGQRAGAIKQDADDF